MGSTGTTNAARRGDSLHASLAPFRSGRGPPALSRRTPQTRPHPGSHAGGNSTVGALREPEAALLYETLTLPPLSACGAELGMLEGCGATGLYWMLTPIVSVEFLPPDPTSVNVNA